MSSNYIINLFKLFSLFLVFSCGTNNNFSEINDVDLDQTKYEKTDKISLNLSINFINELNKNKFTINNYKKSYKNNSPLKVYVLDNEIFALNSNFELLKFDLNNGDLIDTILIDINDTGPLLIPTNFIQYNDKFIIGFKSGLIILVDRNGKIIWLNETNKILNTNIKLYEDTLIAIYEDSIKSIDLNNGLTNWSEDYKDMPIYQAKGGAMVDFANLIYFILPNNKIGSIDMLFGEKHSSNFDDLDIESSINNTNDKLHLFESYLFYLDEGEYLYTFDILSDEFILYKNKILSSNHSSVFVNNALITKNENFIQAINIMNGNIFWKIEIHKSFKKANILDAKILNNKLNLFFDNGVVVEILNDGILNIKELKVKNINQIYFQKNILLTSHLNGKTTIF